MNNVQRPITKCNVILISALIFIHLLALCGGFYMFIKLVLLEQELDFQKRLVKEIALPGSNPEIWQHLNNSQWFGNKREKRNVIQMKEDNSLCNYYADNWCPNLKRQFLENPRAAKGEPGPPGPRGYNGNPGSNGYPGPRGEAGERGLPGLQGPNNKGEPGIAGKDGTPGLAGSSGPRGESGERGLPGLQGAKGEQGIAGISGTPGLIGNPGPRGEKGEPGAPGLQNAKGEPGTPGTNGNPGTIGNPGASGEKGEDGTPGLPGAKGEQGDLGPVGNPGPPGEKGEPAHSGLQGPSLSAQARNQTSFTIQKTQNLVGQPCPPGAQGPPGPPGPQGPPGPKGLCQCHNKNLPLEMSDYGGGQYPGLPPRKTKCILSSTGKSTNNSINQAYSSWMMDSDPVSTVDATKIWTTTDDNLLLFEYADENSFLLNVTQTYDLDVGFKGNAHVIYKNAFFYQADLNKPRIVQYNLASQTMKKINTPGLTKNDFNPLYNSSNYLDFSVDDNGLWVIFPVPDETNTAVMKLDVDTMTPEYIWNITLNHQMFKDMFVAYGILYGVSGEAQDNLKISYGVDLYTKEILDVDLNLTHPSGSITYCHRSQEILLWDKGYKVSYPVECV